ncbi:hypothetical protein [Labrys neptuniae]
MTTDREAAAGLVERLDRLKAFLEERMYFNEAKDLTTLLSERDEARRLLDIQLAGHRESARQSTANLLRANKAEALVAGAVKVAEEAVTQIKYLHTKFQETGSGNNVIGRLNAFLDRAKEGGNG